MNEQLESLYLEYSKTNDVTREMFLNTYNALGAEYISMVEDEINSVKKKEDTQPINQNPTPTGDVNTPILNQEENLNVSVPLSNDLDLNQEQQQLIQPTQNNGVLSSELQLPLETTTTASDLVGVNQDSLSASQEPKPKQQLKDFKTYQSELNNLKSQFTKYESELKKNPLLIERDKIELNIKNLNSQIKSIEEDETFKQKYFKEQDLIKRINELTKTAVDKKLPQLEFNLYKNYDNELNKLNLDSDYKNKSNKLNELYALRNSDATRFNEINENVEVKDLISKYNTSLESYKSIANSNEYKKAFEDYKKNNSLINPKTTLDVGTLSSGVKTEKYLETPNGYVDFGNGIQLPKELLPEEKTQEEFNKEVSNLAKEVELKESGLVPTYDVNNPLWISRNVGNLKGADYVDTILQEEAEGKVKVARNENGELIDENLKPIIDKSNILWQPIGEYVKEYNDKVNKFNEEIKLNNEKVSKNNELIKNEKLRNLFLGQPEEEKSPLTTLYNRIYSDTGILLTEEQKANFKSIDDVYNFYALEKAKKDVKDNPELNYNEEYNKNLNEFNPKITLEQSLNLGNKFVNSFLLGFQLEEEKIFAEARGYGAKIDNSYKKGYASDKDKDEIDFIKNLSNNQVGLSLLGQWWNSVGQKEIGTSNYKINAVLSTKEGRADVINSIVNFVNGKGNLEKELANENIVREKFKNLNNAKLGNTEALKNSINYIQSESKKINDIETQQKEVYSFIDEWKGKQVRQNEVEQEFSKTFSGYQKGDVLPSIKFIAGNTINGISDAFKSTIGGVAQLPNLAIGSDEYNDVIGQITKPTDFFGVKTSGMFSKYYDYESNGKKIRFQNGNYYEVDKNGDYKPIDLTYTQIAGLGKGKEGEEFSIAGMIGDTTRMATDYALVQFTGGLALKGLSKFSQLRNIPKVASVFGEESALTTSLQRLERFSSNPVNKDYFGWFNQTLVDNYQEGKSVGMTNTQAAVYGSVQSLLTAFLARINPDVKFFKLYKELDEKLIGSILKNDKQGFLNGLKSMTNQIGSQIVGEEGQELTGQLAQEVVKQFTNTQLSDKKFDKMTSDDVLKTIITTAVTTGALSSANIATRGNVDNVIKYDNAYYNSTQLSNGQKLVMLANLNTTEIFKNFERQFITDKSKLSEVEKSVSLIKNYLDKIPNKEQYTLNTQTKAVSLLYEIDKKRKQLNQSDEVFKPEVQTEIDNLSGQLKELLDSDIKLQEEVKNNTLVDEQPQTEPQQQQEQEGVQGQSTETNVQPEQTTVATEQGVSIDLNAKTGDTLYKPTEKSVPTDIEVDTNKDVEKNAIQEQTTNEGLLGAEQPSQETTKKDETQKLVEPIGQLGDGSNIYLETPKYRLNDNVKGGYILNISDISNSLTPLKSVEFIDLNEAKYVADFFVENAPKGVIGGEQNVDDFVNTAKENYKLQLQNETEIQQNQPTAEVNQQVESTPNETIATSVQNKTQKEVTYKGKVYKYSSDENGEFITSPKGKRMTEYTEREITKYDEKTKKYVTRKIRVANANFRNIKAKIFGEKTQNEINEEYKSREKEALSHLDDTNETNIALLYFAQGGKVSYDSIKTELGEKVAKELTWAYLGKDGEDSIERVSERLAENSKNPNISQTEIRKKLIEVLGSHGSVKEIKETIVQAYNKSIDPNFGYTDEDIAQLEYQSLPDNIKAIVDSVNAEATLTEEEKLQYEIQEYEKQLQSLSNEEQDQIYNAIYGEQRTQPQNESVQDSITEPTQQEEITTAKEFEKLDLATELGINKVISILDDAEKKLDQFSKETLGISLPIAITKGAIQAMKAAAKTVKAGADVLSVGINYVRNTDWYKNQTKEEQDKINNEFLFNQIISLQEKTQKKQEAKVAKAKAKVISVKEVIEQTILDAKEKGLFKGVTSSSVLEYAMRRINRAVTPYQQKQVLNIVKKIINDNEYLNKVKEAVNTQKDIKKKANSKSISKPLVNVNIAKEFAKINPRNVKDIDEFLALAKAVKSNLSGIAVNNKLEVKNKNYTINNESIQKYIDDNVKYNETLKEEALKDDYNELARTSNLPVANMTFEEYKDFINLSKLEENATKFDDESKSTKEERTKVLSAIVNRRLNNDFKTEVYDKKSEFTEAEQNIIERLFKIDTSTLDYKQLVKLNDIINNAVYNGDLMDAGNISLTAKVRENEKAIDEFKKENKFSFLTLRKDFFSKALQSAISNDMVIEFMTNSTKASAFFKRYSGISAIMDGHAKAKVMQQKAVNSYIKMKKKVGWKSDTTENRYIRGIYAEMIRGEGGNVDENNAEFTRKKGLIEQTITELSKSSNTDDNRASELLSKIYDSTLKNANNVEELKNNILKLEFGKFNIQSVEYWVNEHSKYADDFIEQGRLYNNKNLDREINYTGRKYRPITAKAQKEQDDNIFNEVYRSTDVNYTESGSKTKTVKNKFLPKGLVLDLDFDKVQSKMIYNNLYDLYTTEGISILKEFLGNPDNVERIGGQRNIDKIRSVMRNTILSQKQAMPFENDDFAKALDKISGSIMLKSARLALGSITQLPKQYFSVFVSTAVNLGTDVDLVFKSWKVGNNIKLFDEFNIGQRGSTIAGYNKENAIFADENAGNRDKIRAALYKTDKLSKDLYDGTLKALEFSDVQIARTSWLSFYMQSLRKQGIDLNKIDWENEHKKPNEEAASYAEQMISRLQNANDASSMADAFKNTNTYAKVWKNVALPYSTFAVNQRARMTSDLQKLIYGSIDGRASAARSLVATFAEQAVFNALKLYVLGQGATYLTESILSAVFGWEDDEIKDLYAKGKDYIDQKFVTNVISDFFFSGMGAFTQSALEKGTDVIAGLINGEEYFYDYKNDPEKTGIPNWVSPLGAYGTAVSVGFGLYNDTQYLDGYGEEIVKGGAEPELKEKELSSDAKKLVYLTFGVDALALAGVGDQYITQINQKIKKARDKRIKEDLGDWYKAKMYIPSNKDNFNKYAKLYVDKGYTLQEIRALAMKEGITLDKKFNSKMVDVVYEYKISKYKKEIDAVKLKYEQNKMSREDLKAFVISLDLTLKEKVKLWKELR